MPENIEARELIQKYKTIYRHLQSVYSPAIATDVHFNIQGFKHLIFKGKHRRKTNAIYNRLVLIPLIAPVIRNCSKITETRIRSENLKGNKVEVTYHALESIVGKDHVRVRVVTRKVGTAGKHYFQSVMKY